MLTMRGASPCLSCLYYQAAFHETPAFDSDAFLQTVLEPLVAPFPFKYLYLVDTSWSRQEVLAAPRRLDDSVYFSRIDCPLWEGASALYAWTDDRDSRDLRALTTEGNALLFGDTDLPERVGTGEALRDAVIAGKMNVVTFTDLVVVSLLTHDTTLVDTLERLTR